MERQIDYVATARSLGFRVDSREVFLRDCRITGLLMRATAFEGSHVLWDPEDDHQGYMVIGNDPVDLAEDWYETLDHPRPKVYVEDPVRTRHLGSVKRQLEF